MFKILIEGPIRRPGLDRDQFECRHPGWHGMDRVGPLYALPEKAIARLERPRLGHPPLLDANDAAAERDLLALCLTHHAVGFVADAPIVYPFLARGPRRSFRDDYPNYNYTEAEWAVIAQLEETLNTGNRRLKEYAGWLSTEPPFLKETHSLETRWWQLPDDQRPGFPLRRAAPAFTQPGEPPLAPAPVAVATLAADFDAFCDRWGLLGLATWDLPEPQGPLFPSLLPEDAPALPRHGLHIVIPLHYPLAHDDDLLHQILGLQRGLAAHGGIDRTAAGLPHYEAYATILEVIHWERVITARYGRGRRRSGFIGLVVEAVADAIGREVNLVEKWRKAVSACRRGRRSSVKALRVAVV